MTTYVVSSGTTSSGLVLHAGDYEYVQAGGIAVGTKIQTGGSAVVSAGGMLSNAVVSSGGVEIILSGGTASGSYLYHGAQIDLRYIPFSKYSDLSLYDSRLQFDTGSSLLGYYNQPLASSTINSFVLTDDDGGGTRVTAIAAPTISGVTISGLILPSGNGIVVAGGGSLVSTTVEQGAFLEVLSGGSTTSTIVNYIETVFAGGDASNIFVNSGGLLELGIGSQAGGTANNAIISAGGKATLTYGAVINGVIVYSGGTLYNVVGRISGAVLSGGTESVGGDGAIDSGTIVLAGGSQRVQGAGYNDKTFDTVVNLGGQQLVTAETLAYRTVVNDGGLQKVDWNAHTYGTIVNSGGRQLIQNTVDPGAGDSPPTAFATVVSGGGIQTVGVDGRTSGTILLSGASEVITSGGKAYGTVVYSGGVESVLSGGVAIDTVIYGGTQNVGPGNTISGTRLLNGGLQSIAAGGIASGTIVYSGGTQSVAAGGVADGTTIQFGVSQVVGAGATVTGAVIEAGGRLVVSPGSIVSNTHLKLGGTIDLPNLAYSASETVAITAQSIASYLLTVNNGGQTQTLQLGNNPPGTLKLSNDGNGGTAITAVGSLTGNVTVDGGVLSRAPNMAATSASMVAAMTQALADWGNYILSDRPLQIKINIGQTAYPTELADDVVTFVPLPGKFVADLGTHTKGTTVSQAVVGIASGQAFPSPDITITINQANLNSIYFPPDPSGSYQVPAGKVDLVSLFEHEIGHAIGFDGLRNQAGALQNAESIFDTWMNVTSGSASLVSPAEQNQYRGQPVPLTTGVSNGSNNYTLASGSLYSLDNDLMGPSLKPGQRYQISGLDLAAVKTAGVPAGLGYYSPVGVNQVLAPVKFDSQPVAFTVTPQSDPKLNDIVTWNLPGIVNPTASTVYQIQREIWLTTSAYSPNSQGFLFYSKIEPYVDTTVASLSGSGPSLLPASGTYHVTYVLSEQSAAGRYVQEQKIDGGTITFVSPPSAALTNYTPSQPDEGSDSGGQGGDDSGSSESGIGSSTDSSAGQSDTSQPAALPIYRFYDTGTGTHLFTQSQSEAQGILQTRPDLVEEVDNFGAAEQLSPAAVPVYRFFETGNGTHFFTASTDEFVGLTTPGSASYRPDLTYEPSSTLYVDTIQQAGDVAVYRLFDSAHGTQFLTGSQAEYQGLTTPGSSGYRSDLSPEGIAFYAPQGSSFL